MGGSSSKNKEEKEKEIIKKTNTIDIKESTFKKNEDQEFRKEIVSRKSEPLNTQNYPIFQQKRNAPIPMPKQEQKMIYKKVNDDNLELIPTFNQNKDIAKNIQDNLTNNFYQIFYRITNNNKNYNTNNKLTDVINKVNFDFGFQKSIKNDFDKTKSKLLYCSTLTLEEESFINKLNYEEYIINENKYRKQMGKILYKHINEIKN